MAESELDLTQLRVLDTRALAALHDRYYPEVFRYARYRLGEAETAEDVAGEVFVRLLEAVKAGRAPHTSVRSWLLGTASHLVNDHHRRTYARPTEPLAEETPSESVDPHEAIEQSDSDARVRQALARLTAEQQHVVALRFGRGYSLEETARLMGKDANAIKALQFRALAALRRHLGEAQA